MKIEDLDIMKAIKTHPERHSTVGLTDGIERIFLVYLQQTGMLPYTSLIVARSLQEASTIYQQTMRDDQEEELMPLSEIIRLSQDATFGVIERKIEPGKVLTTSGALYNRSICRNEGYPLLLFVKGDTPIAIMQRIQKLQELCDLLQRQKSVSDPDVSTLFDQVCFPSIDNLSVFVIDSETTLLQRLREAFRKGLYDHSHSSLKLGYIADIFPTAQ